MAGERAGQPTLRLRVSCDPPQQAPDALPDEPVAEVGGVNLHARYITRPVLSEQRLQRLEDGRIQLTLKSTWRDGTRAFVFEPFDLIARLLAAVPPPRFHLLRYTACWRLTLNSEAP